MKSKLVKSIRSAATSICLQNGVNDTKEIQNAVRNALLGIKKMQIAGVKAAISKGQTVGG